MTVDNVTWAADGVDVVQQACTAESPSPAHLSGAASELCSVSRPTLSLPYDPVIYEPPALNE